MTKYFLDLNPRPFEAIKRGTKKIEGRTPTKYTSSIDYQKLKKGGKIIFENNETKEKIQTLILGVRHYKDVKTMLETEGTRNVLSNQGTVKEGIKSYYNLTDYKKNIKKFGIYAIELKPIKKSIFFRQK